MKGKEFVLKLVVIGDSGVGKTCLLERYVKNEFTEHFKTTIGCDFFIKKVIVETTIVSLQIWDTAGQERFRSVNNSYYRGADACILVFDLTDQKSLDNLNRWKDDFMQNSPFFSKERFNNSKKWPFIVVGNKADLVDKECIKKEDILPFVEESKSAYYETSAKDGTGVNEAFFECVKRALKINKDHKRESVYQFDHQGLLTLQKKEPPSSEKNSRCTC